MEYIQEAEVLTSFVFFGICGTMGRAGLVALTAFEGLGSVWPNFTGCFVIAAAPSMFGPLLLLQVATGFCGAMTSFSELITDIFNQSVTRERSWPNSGYGVPLFMARLLLELSCCFAAYSSGLHFGKLYSHLIPKKPTPKQERLIRGVACFFGIAAWVVCIVTAITTKSNHRMWPLCGVFAPFGVWLRYELAKLNTPHWFKWGTFSANVFATLVSCIIELCVRLPHVTPLQRDMMLGIQKGFTGSLSTISTLVKELNTMPARYAYLYGPITLFTGYSLAFIIIGSYRWTRN